MILKSYDFEVIIIILIRRKTRVTKSFRDIMSELPEDKKQLVEKRGEEIYHNYLTLQELRKARELTQEHLAKELKVRQENISRLEKRSDLMLSTLTNYISAIGGELKLIVEIPGHKPIQLKGFEDFSRLELQDNTD